MQLRALRGWWCGILLSRRRRVLIGWRCGIRICRRYGALIGWWYRTRICRWDAGLGRRGEDETFADQSETYLGEFGL